MGFLEQGRGLGINAGLKPRAQAGITQAASDGTLNQYKQDHPNVARKLGRAERTDGVIGARANAFGDTNRNAGATPAAPRTISKGIGSSYGGMGGNTSPRPMRRPMGSRMSSSRNTR